MIFKYRKGLQFPYHLSKELMFQTSFTWASFNPLGKTYVLLQIVRYLLRPWYTVNMQKHELHSVTLYRLSCTAARGLRSCASDCRRPSCSYRPYTRFGDHTAPSQRWRHACWREALCAHRPPKERRAAQSCELFKTSA